MTIPLQSANVYADVQSLNKLKYASDENSPETLRFVAEQFEAIFLQMMLKSAHGENDQSGLFDNQQTEFYQDWHDKQLAITLAQGKGIGIADMLVKQLQVRGVNQSQSQEQPTPTGLDSVIRQQPVLAPGQSEPATAPVSLNSPQAFAQHLWPLAKAAGKKLGVAPEVILAQAALETGWGQKISQSNTGASSHNLFNIKADGRWQGRSVSVPTLEYRNGVAVRETAQFRAYDSYAESFDDFVSFIQGSPRYQSALAVADDARAFTQELSAAGYATDPEYSSKIMKIANGEPLRNALELIKI